jgi:alpha-tubulin suppressor-like RCC1 family protein
VRKRTRAIAASLLAFVSAAAAYACGAGDNGAVGTPIIESRGDSGSAIPGADSAAGPETSTSFDAGVHAGRSTIAVGGSFACVVSKDRAVYCWGRNDVGQLGRDPSTTPSCGAFPCSPTPTKVEGLPRIARIALGDAFACALDEDGSVWCWGDNSKGQLEQVTEPRIFTPRRLIAQISDIVATGAHACALGTDQLLRCWGENTCEIFGKGGSPTRIANVVTYVPILSQVSLGTDAVCGTRLDGKPVCWGADHNGSLGHDLDPNPSKCGGLSFDPVPKTVMEKSTGLPMATIAEVHIGDGVACARHTEGQVVCWGDNSRGGLGQGVADTTAHPRAVDVPGIAAAALEVHGQTPCVVIANGVLCWGDSSFGQLESLATSPTCGNQQCRALGSPITDMSPVHQIASGPGAIAALKDDLSVWMWGRNTSAEIAVAPTDPASSACGSDRCVVSPKQVSGLPPLD